MPELAKFADEPEVVVAFELETEVVTADLFIGSLKGL